MVCIEISKTMTEQLKPHIAKKKVLVSPDKCSLCCRCHKLKYKIVNNVKGLLFLLNVIILLDIFFLLNVNEVPQV